MVRYVYISHSALQHHGILGQKWGKRNGPPYPLDASDHSAAEKKANNGRYSQGVKQDRGKKREPMSEEKKRKIKRAVAIGAGVAGAAALTAGGIYLAKHPNTVKAALSGIKDKASAAREARKAIKSIKNDPNTSAEMKKKAISVIKKHSILKEGAKERTASKIKEAKSQDWRNSMKKKVERRERRNDKKGILSGNPLSEKNLDKMMNDGRFISKNENKIREKLKSQGKTRDEINDYVKGLYNQARTTDTNRGYSARKQQEYKSNHGIRGAAKKVWAPVAATAGVIGTVGGVAGKITGGINNVEALAKNKYVRSAYNDLMYDPYTQQYYDENQQPKKKKN